VLGGATIRRKLAALPSLFEHLCESNAVLNNPVMGVKRLLGNSENALPVQIVSAFVIDLLLRAFKHGSGFTSSLYEFVSNCQEFSLVPLKELANNALHRALETIFRLFDDTKGAKSPLHLPT
jgi:hypothetical protein